MAYGGANNAQGNNGQAMQLDARRTLVIGMGSTGSYICNQILEHLSWAFGSPDNVPWVKCLVFETADIPADKAVHRNARVEYLRIAPGKYQQLINSPSKFADSMDFPAWNNPTATGSHSAIAFGANNTRILGRLALLFPENFARVDKAIRREKQNLSSTGLALATAQRIFSEAMERPVSLNLPDNTFVYVVGTLCGGTGSGGFIDMGYLLQHLGLENATGIFTLPAHGEVNRRLVANAVAALVELNHYSDDRNRYRVKWPGSIGGPQNFSPGQIPYHHCYLMQSREAGAAAYRQLMTSIADYVYADLVGPTAGERDAKRVNISNWFNERDTEGATQRFFTFGLTSIEFPVIRVSNACQVKLLEMGMEQMIRGREDADTIGKNSAKQLRRLSREPLVTSLAMAANNVSLFDTFRSVIKEAEVNAEKSNDPAAILRRFRQQLDAGFSRDGGQTHSKIDANIVKNTIEANALKVQDELLDDIRKQLAAFLIAEDDIRVAEDDTRMDIPLGIELARTFLTVVRDSLAKEFQEGSDALPTLEKQITEAVNQVDECHKDLFLKFTLTQKTAVKRYISTWGNAASSYYEQRIKVVATPIADARRKSVLREVQAMLDRVTDAQVGLARRTRQRVEELKALYATLDSNAEGDEWSRRVNGRELFFSGPGGTIDREFELCLREELRRGNVTGDYGKAVARLAIFSTRDYFSNVMESLKKSSLEQTEFDDIGGNRALPLDGDKLMQLCTSAAPYFSDIRNRSVIDRLMVQDDSDAQIRQAATPDRPLSLNWFEGSPRYNAVAQKQYEMRSYNNDTDHPAFETLLENARLEMPLVPILDKHQIMFLREQGAFSLATITDLQDPDSDWWRIYLNERDVIHARADIPPSVWTTWYTDNDDYAERLRSLFLWCVATGVCEFEGGTKFRFRAPRRGPRDPEFQEFNNDLSDVIAMIRSKDLEGAMLLQFNQKVNDLGPIETVETMEKFFQEGIHLRDAEENVSHEEIEMHFKTLIYRRPDLQGAFEAKFPNLADSMYIRQDQNGVSWYYCPNPRCGARLGKSPLNLRYYDTDERKYVRKCQICRQAIA